MFKEMQINQEQLYNDLLQNNDWEKINFCLSELPDIIEASHVLANNENKNIINQLQSLAQILIQVRRLKILVEKKKNDLMVEQILGEKETNANSESNHIEKCISYQTLLNKADEIIGTNIPKMADKLKLNNEEEENRVQKILQKFDD